MQRDRESSSRELARLSVSRITLMNLSNAYMLTSIDLRIQNLNNTCMLTSIDSGVPTGSPPTLMISDKVCHSHAVTHVEWGFSLFSPAQLPFRPASGAPPSSSTAMTAQIRWPTTHTAARRAGPPARGAFAVQRLVLTLDDTPARPGPGWDAAAAAHAGIPVAHGENTTCARGCAATKQYLYI